MTELENILKKSSEKLLETLKNNSKTARTIARIKNAIINTREKTLEYIQNNSETVGAIATTILGTSMILYAYAESPKHPTSMISGTESVFKSGEDNKYKIESQIIYDDTLFTWDISNTGIDTSKYLPIAFTKKSEGKRKYNVGTGETKIIPGPAYIPQKIPGLTRLPLEDIGVYEDPLSFTEEGKAKLRTAQSTDKNLHFSIETMNMGKNGQYFFPHVEDEIIEDHALPFYMIPVNTSTLEIEESSKDITLWNSKQGMYKPIKIKDFKINPSKSLNPSKKYISGPGKVKSEK
jgi:hypothetical protein